MNKTNTISLSNIEIPEFVEPESISIALDSYARQKQSDVAQILKHPDIITTNPNLIQGVMCLTNTLSGDQVVSSPDREKAYSEFIQLVTSIDPQSITDENAKEIATKLGYTFLGVFR
jgi:hypothetical protein